VRGATLVADVTRRSLRDGLLAAVALAAQLALLGRHGGIGVVAHHHYHALDVGGGFLAALATLPLALWRRNVLAVFVVTTIASCTLNLIDYLPGPPVGATIALFLFAATTPALKRGTLALVAALLAAHVATIGIGEHRFPTVPLIFGIVEIGRAHV